MIKIQRWNMLRTKCFNIRLIKFIRFGLQLNREFYGSINGGYIGLNVVIEIPFNPFRIKFFIPSIESLESIFKDNRKYKKERYLRLSIN